MNKLNMFLAATLIALVSISFAGDGGKLSVGDATNYFKVNDDGSAELSGALTVGGGVTDVAIAANAVGTASITNGAVTAAKTATAVQTSLGKADTALQPNAVALTNIIVDADAKTNTFIVVGGQITSWIVTE